MKNKFLKRIFCSVFAFLFVSTALGSTLCFLSDQLFSQSTSLEFDDAAQNEENDSENGNSKETSSVSDEIEKNEEEVNPEPSSPDEYYNVSIDTDGATGGSVTIVYSTGSVYTETYSYDSIDSSGYLFSSYMYHYDSGFTYSQCFYITCNLEKDGYIFIGWQVYNTSSIYYIDSYGVSSSSSYGEVDSDLNSNSSSTFTYYTTDSPTWDLGTELYFHFNNPSDDASSTFTALWEEGDSYSLTYNSNYPSATGLTDETTTQKVYCETAFTTLASSAFSCDGYTFLGWGTTAQDVVYADDFNWSASGASYTGADETFWTCNTSYVYDLEEDDQLYAVWMVNDYTITYNSNFTAIDETAENETKTQTVYYKNSFETMESSTFSYKGYALLGWSTTQMEIVEEFSADEVTSFVGGDDVNLVCGASYTYDLTEDVTLYAVWKKDFAWWEDGYWFFEDGYMPQSYYGSSKPSAASASSTGSFEVNISASSYALVYMYGEYALVQIYTFSSSVYTCTASGWFNVEPIKWLVECDADGTGGQDEYSYAVTAQVVMYGYVASSVTSGWSARSSALQASVNSLASVANMSLSTTGFGTYDIFTSPTSQGCVTRYGSLADTTIDVASIDEIDAVGGAYAATCTDFVAFLASGGVNTTGGYVMEYWTRDLAYDTENDSYPGAWNNGVYVTEDGTLLNSRLSFSKGARLSIWM